MTLSSLGYHLGQIISHDPSSKYNLVPDPFGQTIHSSGSLMGGIWYVVWISFRGIDWGDELRPFNLLVAIHHIYESWSKEIQKLDTRLRQLHLHLKDKLDSEDLVFRQDVDYQYINCWHFEVLSAFSHNSNFSMMSKIQKIHEVFKNNIEFEDRTYEKADDYFIYQLFIELEDVFSLFKIKALVKDKIPVEIFQKIALGDDLSIDDEERFRQFALRLLHLVNHPKEQKRISQETFHRGFCIFIHSITQQTTIPFFKRLAKVYYFLNEVFQEQGSSFFTVSDPNYLKKVTKIFEGSCKEILTKGGALEIGDEILTFKEEKNSRHRIFNTVNHSFEVLVFSTVNAFELFLDYENGIQKNYGLPLSDIIDIGPSGVMICEKLSSESLATYLWSNDKDQSRFLQRFESLKLLYQHMLCFNYTPKEFSSDYLHFDMVECIKFTKFFPMGSLDIDLMINVAMECLGDDLDLYASFVESCGLAEHEICQFYLKFATLGLADKKIEQEILSQEMLRSSYHKKEEVLIKAAKIQRNLESIFLKSTQRILKYYSDVTLLRIKEIVKSTLIELLQKLKALPQELGFKEDDIIMIIADKHKLNLKKEAQQNQRLSLTKMEFNFTS